MARGKLITVEGVDGAGKTTLTLALRDALREQGVDAKLLREPGGVRVAELIRELVKNRELEVSARAEALLYAAARAQLVQEALVPLLDSGALVLLDRFVDSSLAYQGAGRELGIEAVREINRFATGGLTADRTLLLDLEPTLGRTRSRGRGDVPDRLELESEPFFHRIADAYRELAAAEPDRIRTIDASQPPDLVLAASLRAVADLL
jgi:dTMP kinase